MLDQVKNIIVTYIEHAAAYLDYTTVNGHRPDQQFMREIEEYHDVPEQMADDFRRIIIGLIGRLASKGVSFESMSVCQMNIHLAKACCSKWCKDLSRQAKFGYALTWDSQAVVKIAAGIVETENYGNSPILADALEEGGYTDVAVLNHLRTVDLYYHPTCEIIKDLGRNHL